MPRSKKCRKIGFVPKTQYFTPSDKKDSEIIEVVLIIEELEAIRLSDLKGLDQDKSAESMGISRGTLQRILNNAHEKIADALVNGKVINIDGDNYIKYMCSSTCERCNCVWKNNITEDNKNCSNCDNVEIYYCGKGKEFKCPCDKHIAQNHKKNI